ncbi:hypothetical protein MXB_3914 [Myxobolus squamalis]|nr:hypothetical protein MXB_3914 [Myxobolus squamalis]
MSMSISFALNHFRTILIDCDGKIYHAQLRCTLAFVRSRNKAKKSCRGPYFYNKHYKVAFITNNSVYTRKAFMNKLNNLGFEATEDECFCGAFFTALYLKAHSITKTSYIIGSVGLAEEISNQGIQARLIDVN